MGRGLSTLQKSILDVLPDYRDDLPCTEAPTRVELVRQLGLPFTPSNRVAVTRAVSRLYDRELILHVWGFDLYEGEHKIMCGQRTGYARATPEQVEVFKQDKQAFLEKCELASLSSERIKEGSDHCQHGSVSLSA